MSTIPRSSALAAAALLAACGGGGGGGPAVVVPEGARSVPASANADVSVANYATLAAPFVRAVLSGGANGLISPLAAERRSAQGAAPAPLAFVPGMPGRQMLAWLRRLPDPARKRATAVSTDVLPCALSGSITLRFDDADGDNNLSAGDTIGFTASSCDDGDGLPAANGGFTMAVNAVDLDGSEPVALDVTGAFQNFSLVGYGTINGQFRLWTRFETAASTRLRVSYQGATVAEAGATVVYDFDIDGLANEQSGSFEISGGIGIGGATYAVSTGSRLQVGVGQPPSGGNAAFRDAAGDSVRLWAQSAAQFELDFYVAGSGSPSASLTGLFWADYTD